MTSFPSFPPSAVEAQAGMQRQMLINCSLMARRLWRSQFQTLQCKNLLQLLCSKSCASHLFSLTLHAPNHVKPGQVQRLTQCSLSEIRTSTGDLHCKGSGSLQRCHGASSLPVNRYLVLGNRPRNIYALVSNSRAQP